MITRLTKHDTHQMRIHLTKPNSKHYAALRCVDCDKHVQWINYEQAKQIRQLGVKTVKPWITAEELNI